MSMWDTNSTMTIVTAPFVMTSLSGTVPAASTDVLQVPAWSVGLNVALSGFTRASKCNVQDK